MIGDQREIGVPRRDETGTNDVEPERAREFCCIGNVLSGLQVARSRVEAAGSDEDGNRRQGRGQQNAEGAMVAEARRDDSRDEEWADDRTRLVHRLMETKAPAVPDLFRAVREHRVTCGRAYGFAQTLGDHQPRGKLPSAGECKQRHGE